MSDDDHLLIGRAFGRLYRREDITESYVSMPPASAIILSDGTTWTWGFQQNFYGEWNLLRNDVDTGMFVNKVDVRAGVLRIYGREFGTKTLSRSRRHFI